MTRSPRQIDSPVPGIWLIRCCRRCPPVVARIWFCQTEPGTDNEVDQPYLQGQIALELVPPVEVWHRRGIEITAAEFAHQMNLLRWLADNRPTDPRLQYRTPVNIDAVPIPRWSAP